MAGRKPYAGGLNGAVAAVLRGERAMLQLTIAELAERSGLTDQSLRRYLATERAIDVEVLYAVAQGLGLTGAEVMARAQDRLAQQQEQESRDEGVVLAVRGNSALKKALGRKKPAPKRKSTDSQPTVSKKASGT